MVPMAVLAKLATATQVACGAAGVELAGGGGAVETVELELDAGVGAAVETGATGFIVDEGREV